MQKILNSILSLILVVAVGSLVTSGVNPIAGVAAAIFMLVLVNLYALMVEILEVLKKINKDLIIRLS
jgi:hypothetical protein